MLCRKCGAENPDHAKKCGYCGASLVYDKKTEEENEKNRQRQKSKMLEEKQAQLSEIQQRRDEKRLKQRRNKIIGISAICVAGAAALGGGGYYVYNSVTGSDTIVVTPGPTAAATASSVTASTAPIASAAASPATSPSATSAADSASWTASGESSGNSSSGSSSSSGGSSSSGSSSSGSGSSSSGSSSSGGSSSGGSSSGISSSSGGSSSTGSSSTGSSGGSSSNGSSSSGSSSAAASLSGSGVSSTSLSNSVAVGDSVVQSGNNWYMSFVSDGKIYYANVNSGATTSQVQGMNYVLDAKPTSETYNGNTVYEITSMVRYDGTDYILPMSGVRKLTDSDISGMSAEELSFARNEIYARHGRKFQTEKFQEYFESKAWYEENPNYNYNDDNANLSAVEAANVTFLLNAEENK